MAVKRKLISTRTLESGMRIDQTITDSRTGKEMIVKGTYLDDFQIGYLRSKGIASIYVSEGDPDPDELEFHMSAKAIENIAKETKADAPKVEISREVLKQVGEGVQYMFSNTDSENFAEASQNVSRELVKAVLSNDAVAMDITMLKSSDDYTFRHSVEVATMSMLLGKNYGLTRAELEELCIAGLLHDIGKSRIPNEVLNKAGRLTDEEFALMKQHSLFGFQILKEKQNFSEAIMLGVLQHHEKLNGRGYPVGSPAEKIHKFARIIAVADIYDALVTKRPYKDPFSQRVAVEMIMAMTEELEMEAIKTFMRSVNIFAVGSMVKLHNGEKIIEYAKVVQNFDGYPNRPKVVGVDTGQVYDLLNDSHYLSMAVDKLQAKEGEEEKVEKTVDPHAQPAPPSPDTPLPADETPVQ